LQNIRAILVHQIVIDAAFAATMHNVAEQLALTLRNVCLHDPGL